jgi:ATP-dependent DNA helicase PIF1
MTQAGALKILKTGANVFLTGEPGSGKTHTINAYVNFLREHDIEPAITASTGIAATHIGGMTIHAWSGIGIKDELSPYDLDRLSTNEYLVKRLTKTKVLIIDEVSMLSAETLNMVDQVCRALRRSELSFGGLQVVLVGDFFQLPPVTRSGQRMQFAFQSASWRELRPLVLYLHEQHRQDDQIFLNVLSALRLNKFDVSHQGYLASRVIGDEGELPVGVTKLFCHNQDVDRLNDDELECLETEARCYQMQTTGRTALVETLKKGCLSPENLKLKVGATIMFTKNNPQAGFVNGTLGVVMAYEQETDYPIIKTRHGQKITVSPMDWSVEEEGKIKARINQIPLRLAWAITVHKSQGMSLDEAVIDLGAAFEYGQGYVALSRVRRLSGLHLIGYNERSLLVHPDILKDDHRFREESKAAAEAFSKLSADELEQMHENFILASAGSLVKKTVKPKAPPKARRKKKINL